MNVFARAVVILLALSLAVALRAAEPALRVEGSRDLRLAIVDSNKNIAARDAMHRAFAASLGAALSNACGAPVEVKAKCVNADHAAFNLGTGVYDAVLAIGAAVPRALILSDCARLSVTLDSGRNERKAYLIFGTGDATLAKWLTEAFMPAITDARFLDAMDGRSEHVAAATAGAKLAQSP